MAGSGAGSSVNGGGLDGVSGKFGHVDGGVIDDEDFVINTSGESNVLE
ncbi:MAG: hypothetical protein R2875_17615 [Desulfobacterales bacterium]